MRTRCSFTSMSVSGATACPRSAIDVQLMPKDQGVHHGAGRFAGPAAHGIPVDQDLAHHVLGDPRSAGTLDDNFRAKVVSTQE